MKFAALMAVAAAALSPDASQHPGPLSGTWVADLATQQSLPTDVYLVRDGIYSCESCTPPRRFPADGRLRVVDGDPGVSETVRVVDPRTISTHIVRPDMVRTTRMRVSRDGQSALYVSIDRRPGISGPLRTEYEARRAAPAPAGAHAASGTWQGVRYISVPIQLRTTTLTDSGDRLSYRSGSGFSYMAGFDGAPVPVVGPYDGSISVSVRRLDSRRIVETRRRNGEDVQVRTYTLAPDGRSMDIATTDLTTNSTFRITARRRPSARGR
jgi:hypothetical protein